MLWSISTLLVFFEYLAITHGKARLFLPSPTPGPHYIEIAQVQLPIRTGCTFALHPSRVCTATLSSTITARSRRHRRGPGKFSLGCAWRLHQTHQSKLKPHRSLRNLVLCIHCDATRYPADSLPTQLKSREPRVRGGMASATKCRYTRRTALRHLPSHEEIPVAPAAPHCSEWAAAIARPAHAVLAAHAARFSSETTAPRTAARAAACAQGWAQPPSKPPSNCCVKSAQRLAMGFFSAMGAALPHRSPLHSRFHEKRS